MTCPSSNTRSTTTSGQRKPDLARLVAAALTHFPVMPDRRMGEATAKQLQEIISKKVPHIGTAFPGFSIWIRLSARHNRSAE